MKSYHFGDVLVSQVIEQRGPGFEPAFLYPEWDPSFLEEHRALMIPDCFDEAQQRFVASIHTWVVRTPRHTILIDTCAGNHKQRPGLPRFHQLDFPYLERLAGAGVKPEAVDFVMCTHLHADHCGWNTQLVDGRWVPTFPNAKYVFSQSEYDYWKNSPRDHGFNANVFDDSVLPVIERGQHQIIAGAGAIGDSLLIHPTPGHSVGHLAFELERAGRRGIFCGDVMHQPVQVFRPDWNSCFCENPEDARRSRRWLLEHAAEHETTIFTAHFANSSAGRVSRSGDVFNWTFI